MRELTSQQLGDFAALITRAAPEGERPTPGAAILARALLTLAAKGGPTLSTAEVKEVIYLGVVLHRMKLCQCQVKSLTHTIQFPN